MNTHESDGYLPSTLQAWGLSHTRNEAGPVYSLREYFTIRTYVLDTAQTLLKLPKPHEGMLRV